MQIIFYFNSQIQNKKQVAILLSEIKEKRLFYFFSLGKGIIFLVKHLFCGVLLIIRLSIEILLWYTQFFFYFNTQTCQANFKSCLSIFKSCNLVYQVENYWHYNM